MLGFNFCSRLNAVSAILGESSKGEGIYNTTYHLIDNEHST